ncbi:hypothetical protein F3J23_10795 [Chryseobacterium sp. Tr-659]|uniref:hypothetical protein n=1 Tax=Chryseobacterium sp. Tr-659 TaxID=2608340 RepID=UPI001423E008|nr:hypothetical protein [Chryseobacterium sp. Tr-659]NIF05928.1 hypothetical protein [Chryseobacterium sp. Tr-659]
MSEIKTTFLDKVNNENLSKSDVVNLFKNLNDTDLEYSNTGYLQFEISDESNIILQFSAVDKENISFRYDENIPNVRNGQSWYSSNGSDYSEIVDAGDENYVPKNSFLNMEKTVNIISEFFENPKQKPSVVFWTNAEDFDWE